MNAHQVPLRTVQQSERLAGILERLSDNGTVNVGELAETFPGRVRLDGPSLRLNANKAQALGMIAHELATNAAKYGALSSPSGWIDLKWTLETLGGEPGLRITWRETGGPPVKRPRRTGFGTRLIQRGLAADLNGQVTLDFRREGVVCVIEAGLRPAPETAEFGVSILREARSFEPEGRPEPILN